MALSMDEIEFLARRAGMTLTAEQKAKLLADSANVTSSCDRVHSARPFTTEPVTAFGWNGLEDD